jgi:hypothetical protein
MCYQYLGFIDIHYRETSSEKHRNKRKMKKKIILQSLPLTTKLIKKVFGNFHKNQDRTESFEK